MPNSSTQATQDTGNESAPTPEAPRIPALDELNKFLQDNYAEFECHFHAGDPRHYEPYMRYQINLYHNSRLYSVYLKRLIGAHGDDPNQVAQKVLEEVKERYEEEKRSQIDYLARLQKHLDEHYKVEEVIVLLEDRKDRAQVHGVRYRITVELAPSSDEYKRCGSIRWVFAKGLGRDKQQASNNALEMLLLKERKHLLWINEVIRKKEKYFGKKNIKLDDEVNYFDRKELKQLKKQMEEDKIVEPKSYIEPVRPEITRSDSTLSMKTIWSRSPIASAISSAFSSPFSSPTQEKKSFISDTDLAVNTGSAKTITPKRNLSNLSNLVRRPGRNSGSASTSGTQTPASQTEGSKPTNSKHNETDPAAKSKKHKQGDKEQTDTKTSGQKPQSKVPTDGPSTNKGKERDEGPPDDKVHALPSAGANGKKGKGNRSEQVQATS